MTRRRRIVIAAALLGTCVCVLVSRAVWEGYDALSQGDEAHAAHDSREAVRWWARAARWYVPMAPHVEAAYDRLESFANGAEARDDIDNALAAWRAIRGSVNATRSIYTPFAERRQRANEHIARLMARQEVALAGVGSSGDEPGQAKTGQEGDRAAQLAKHEAFHAQLLARDPQPRLGWALTAIFGFFIWIGGALLFAFRGIDADDRLRHRPAAASGGIIALGLVLWTAGLYLA